jgi:hypothetical protein
VISEFTKEFLALVMAGIGHQERLPMPEQIDWQTIEALANEQGLSAVVVDGIEKLPFEKRPPKAVLLQWIGETLQGYEYRYGQYRKAIAEMASFYNKHGFRMMVLKGYACSLDWPRPDHRPCGDIDIWLFGQQKKADAALAARFKKFKGFRIDNSHHHHSVFYWHDFMVENHYDFVNVHARRSSRELEKVFKELGQDDSHFVELGGEKVYLPSPDLHALFLMRHLVAHFTGASISLRQVLDWAFFVKAHTKEIDWEWLVDLLEKYHMKDFYNCLNAICVENLGFDAAIFHGVQFNPMTKDRILRDIVKPQLETEEPEHFIPRLLFKYKRWKGNAWKRKLCYMESDWSAFLKGIWAHLLKPASI